MKTDQRWDVLALVRFFLATIVVSTHLTLPISHHSVFYRWHQWGGLAAVCAFLVISGYSIGASLDREQSHFYARRFWRIYPVYLVCILFGIGVWYLNAFLPTPESYGMADTPPVRTILFNLLLIQGFLGVALHSDSPVWSLSIEVSLYAVAPRLRRMATWALLMLTGLSSAAFVIHEYLPRKPIWYESHGVGAVCVAWAWILGFLWHRHQKALWIKILIPTLGGALLLSFGPSEGRFAPLTFALVSILLFIAPQIRLDKRVAAFCSYLGELSYPLYLVHVPMIILVQQLTHTTQPLAYLLTSTAGAMILYHGVDAPCRRLGKRMLTRQSTPPVMTLAHPADPLGADDIQRPPVPVRSSGADRG